MGAKKKAASKPFGRSWLKEAVTLDEIRKLTKAWKDAVPLFDDERMDGSEYDVQVVDGALHVKGDLRTFEHNLCGLVITGDLIVDGLYAETDDPACGVFVLGNMKAAGVVTTGTLGVKGSLTVTEACLGFYNDYRIDREGPHHAALRARESPLRHQGKASRIACRRPRRRAARAHPRRQTGGTDCATNMTPAPPHVVERRMRSR